MPTLAFRRGYMGAAREGYSLLEILVVLAILGLAAALSGPSVTRMIERYEAQSVVRIVEGRVSEMRLRAFLRSSPLTGEEIEAQLNEISAEGWSISVPETMTINASGYCTGGELVLQEPAGRTWRRTLSEGECRPDAIARRLQGFALAPRRPDEA